jgi:hypothetical protein
MQNHGRCRGMMADGAKTSSASESAAKISAQNSGRKHAAALVWIAAGILLALYFARIDDWLYKNETFNNLAMGFEVAPEHPALVAFSKAALANCEEHPVEDLKQCRRYQGVITQNLYFAEPIQAFFGSLLAYHYGEEPWLLAVHRAAVWAQITTALLAVALWLLFTASLPKSYGALVSAAAIALILMAYFQRGDFTFVLPDPITDGVQAWEGPALIALAAVVLWGVPRAGTLLAWGPAARTAKWLDGGRRCWLLLAALVLVQLILPLAFKPVAQAAAVALLLLLLVREVKDATFDPKYLLIAAILLLILVSGDKSMLLRKLEVPRYSAFLVFGAAMAYIAVWPRGRLILLLPVIVVFHASVSALLGLALVCAELPILLVRRKLSPAMIAGLLTCGCGLLVTSGFETDLLGLSGEAVRHLVQLLWDQPWRLLSLIIVLATTASLTFWPLFSRDPENDDLVRIGILTMQIVVLSDASNLLLAADPALRAMPGYFPLIQTASHLNPGLAFGAVLALFVWLARAGAQLGRVSAGDSQNERNLETFLRPAMVLLVLIGIANVNFKPRPFLIDTVNNLVTYAVLERIHPDWCKNLQDASHFDDHYVLSVEEPTNGPENYFSVLKLKTRIAAGVHDLDRMTIGNAPPPAATGDDGAPEPRGLERFWNLVREHFSAHDCT